MYNPIRFEVNPLLQYKNPIINDSYNNLENLAYNAEWWVNLANVIPGVRPSYFVSTFGRIYSSMSHKFLKPHIIGRGYISVKLYFLDGSKKDYLLHRLIKMAFEPIPNPDQYQINHIDGDKLNNCLYNLEWVTQSENLLHMYEAGLRKPGQGHMFNSLFNEEQVHAICKALQDGLSYDNICINILYARTPEDVQRYKANIKLIHEEKNWKHISRFYDFSEDL